MISAKIVVKFNCTEGPCSLQYFGTHLFLSLKGLNLEGSTCLSLILSTSTFDLEVRNCLLADTAHYSVALSDNYTLLVYSATVLGLMSFLYYNLWTMLKESCKSEWFLIFPYENGLTRKQ